VLATMIPKDQQNITTLKRSTGQLFTAATQHLTPAVVKYKNLDTLKHFKVGHFFKHVTIQPVEQIIYDSDTSSSFKVKPDT
jgi:hypothetical protein